jgi:amino acid adenylation domain-containing protein
VVGSQTFLETGRAGTRSGSSGAGVAGDIPAPGECVGPIEIPSDVRLALRRLADGASVNNFVPLSICATVLMRRLCGDRTHSRACVIRGAFEAMTPAGGGADGPAGAADPTVSFWSALQRAAGTRMTTVPDAYTVEDADVTFLVSDDGRRLYVETTTSSPDVPLAESWAGWFLRLLTGLAMAPDAPMTDHPLDDEIERKRILHGLNPYRPAAVSRRTMTEPFEEQVERTPDAEALLDGNGASVSFRQLNERANRLAHLLRGRGAGPGTRIAICLERGIDQIVAIYAAVKTGAGYVPLDADLPDSRLEFIARDAEPLFVVTDAASRGRIPAGRWGVLDVEVDRDSWASGDPANLVAGDAPATLLNILYTSGTTGRPKGVAYPTAGALAHLAWMQQRYPYAPGDSAVFKTSPGFDVSIWEIFWPLFHGARLVICRPGGHRDPDYLASLVESHKVTTIYLAPTVMIPFLEKVSADRAGELRWTLCGGEPVTPRILTRFGPALPNTTLVNCYGPTEAGTVTDMALVPEPDARVVPLGRPAANFRLTLLDEYLDLVPVGVPGEAYIASGTGLALAYWRAAGGTAERFVADPYGPPGSRMYRTGDLCRYRHDGVLEHLGRLDRQVKIRGLRIEPAEIESVLAAHPAVGDCAVVAYGDPVRLLAFVVPAGRTSVGDLDAAAILDHAASLLPSHMRPERVMPVLRIPATVNGKADTDALIRVWRASTDRERQVVPPADEVEATLVEIYSQVLETSPVSVLDTFVQLGGHSVLAFQLLDRCSVRLPAQPDVAELLTATLRDVAASVRAAAASGAGPANERSRGD